MKCILYVTVFTMLVVRTKQAEDYNLLPLELIRKYSNVVPSIDASAPGGTSLNFTGIHTEIPISELEFSGKNVSSPYFIHMKFKLSQPIWSSIFSIKDDSTARMIVGITADESEAIISLTIKEEEEISFIVTDNMVGKWTEITLRVNKENVTLFNQCEEVITMEALGSKDVEFANDAFLVFGNTQFEIFYGSIAKLKLYPHADEFSVESLCTETPVVTSDHDDDEDKNYNKNVFDVTTSKSVTVKNMFKNSQVSYGFNVPNLDSEYNLLPIGLISKYSNVEPPIDESISEDFFLNYSGTYTKIPVSELGFIRGQNISDPFMIRITFKLSDQVNQSSMFSIEDSSNVWMMLQFTTANDTTIITLKIPGTEDIHFVVNDIVGKRTNYLININDGNVTLFNNCTELQKIASSKMKNITFSDETFLVLGNNGSGFNSFHGSINELKLYPNVNTTATKIVCDSNGVTATSIMNDLECLRLPCLILPPDQLREDNKCQCSENDISSLLKKMPEMRGPAGKPGPQGAEGPSGLNGSMGIQGPQGERGPQGLRGETGEKGAYGKAGRDGESGSKGDTGKDGPQGPPGPSGISGPSGPPGSPYVLSEEDKREMKGTAGEKGIQGSQGPLGPIGPKGEKGQTGEIGKQGLRGEQGIQGLKGQQGDKGDIGEAGKDGNPGIAGKDGKEGKSGEKGEKGDTGSQGPAGLPGTLTELLDPNMKPHEYAQIVEKLRGERGENGTDGEKGSKGDMGLSGTPGTPGKDGQNGKEGPSGPQGSIGDIGPVGLKGSKGEQGNPGPPGQVPDSVIASMKSSKGEMGNQGPKGNRGPNGYTGKAGLTGKVGAKGTKGDKGAGGPIGPRGPSGYNGTVGEKGQKGECAAPFDFEKFRGDKGDRGVPGQQGKPGLQGPAGLCVECNKVSIIGPSGPPGPPGPPGVSLVGPKGEPGRLISFDPPVVKDADVHTAPVMISTTTQALVSRTSETSLGTLAYVPEDNILLIRVEHGWQYVKMNSLSSLGQPVTTTSTTRPHYRTLSKQITTSKPESTTSLPKSTTSRPGLPNKSNKTYQYIRIAALNDPYTGKMKNLHDGHQRDADLLCFEQSNKYGGDFQAFWNNRADSIKSIIYENYRKLPVRNLHGDLLFYSWESIFDGTGGYFKNFVNIFSFNGGNVMSNPHWPLKQVWHGSNAFGVRHTNNNCKEWQSEISTDYGMASSLHNRRLLGQKPVSCDKELIVLCVGVSQ